jgi:hypothetical protein
MEQEKELTTEQVWGYRKSPRSAVHLFSFRGEFAISACHLIWSKRCEIDVVDNPINTCEMCAKEVENGKCKG